VDLRRDSPTYGHITSTPKPGWENVDLAGSVSRALNVSGWFSTLTSTEPYSVKRAGAPRKGLSDALYLTIGTGIGGGALVNGRVAHGLLHPEMGHLRLPHDLFHAILFLVPVLIMAIAWKAWRPAPPFKSVGGAPAGALPPDHPAWELGKHIICLLPWSIWPLLFSPRRILLGGGSHATAAALPNDSLRILPAYSMATSATPIF